LFPFRWYPVGIWTGTYDILTFSWSSSAFPDEFQSGADAGFVGLEAYTSFEAFFKERIQNYEYKIRYESEHILGSLSGA
jgi:hypothetical protein